MGKAYLPGLRVSGNRLRGVYCERVWPDGGGASGHHGKSLWPRPMSWHMKEVNELTRRLLAEGSTPEDTPPGTCEYKSYYGGWTYTSQALNQMVFETPCGLLVRGSRFTNGYLASRGVDWRPENDNPVVPCPRFASGPCSLRHPLLQTEKLCCGPDDVVYQCDCHPTDRPYTYDANQELNKSLARAAAMRPKI